MDFEDVSEEFETLKTIVVSLDMNLGMQMR